MISGREVTVRPSSIIYYWRRIRLTLFQSYRIFSHLSEKDEHLPMDLPSPRYVNTRNEKAPHLGQPTAVHRIVFRSHLSSRSGITLPRWYTMTFISGFVRLRPWSFLSYPCRNPSRTLLSSRATRICAQPESCEINARERYFLKYYSYTFHKNEIKSLFNATLKCYQYINQYKFYV